MLHISRKTIFSVVFASPVILALLIIPLLIHAAVVVLPAEFARASGAQVHFDVFAYSREWATAFLGCAGVALAALASRTRVAPEVPRDFSLPLAAWLAAITLSHLLTPFPAVSVMGCPDMYAGFVMKCGLVALAWASFSVSLDRTARRCMVAAFTLAALAVFGVALAQSAGYRPVSYAVGVALSGGGAAPFATFGNSNHLGMFCAIAVPFFVGLSVRRPVFLPLVALAGYVLAISSSRAGFCGAVVGAGLAVALQLRERRAVGLLVLAALLASILAYPAALRRLCSIFHALAQEGDGFASRRGHIWRHALALARRCLVIGTGPGTFALAIQQDGSQFVDKPHSIYFQALVESGGVALLAHLALWARLFWRLVRRTVSSAVPFAAGCAGYLVAGLATDGVNSVAPLFWIFVGCSFSILSNPPCYDCTQSH